MGSAILESLGRSRRPRRDRLAPAGHLVGRRAVPAVAATPSATRPRPGRPCSTRVRLDPARVHPMPALDGPDGPDVDAAAARYAARAGRRRRPGCQDVPQFDVLMLGVGPDAHVASLFPEHPALHERGATTVAVRGAPKPPPVRISLTFPALCAARDVWFLVSGADKAAAVGLALSGSGEMQAPAAGVSGTRSTTWLLDRDAATHVPRQLIRRPAREATPGADAGTSAPGHRARGSPPASSPARTRERENAPVRADRGVLRVVGGRRSDVAPAHRCVVRLSGSAHGRAASAAPRRGWPRRRTRCGAPSRRPGASCTARPAARPAGSAWSCPAGRPQRGQSQVSGMPAPASSAKLGRVS